MKDIALFDMDGSLADYNTALVNELNRIRHPIEKEVDSTNLWELENKYPHIKERMQLIKNQPGFWLKLNPMAGGLRVWTLCKYLGFHNVILTKGPKKHAAAWAEKLQWCQEHLGPSVDVHIVSDKSIVYGKLLYDDYPAYMEKWLKHRPRGVGIMPAAPYNKDFVHPNVFKYDEQDDFRYMVKVIESIKNRKHGEPYEVPTRE